MVNITQSYILKSKQMTETKIVGYKKIFGLVLPDWVNEEIIRRGVAGLLSSVVMLLVLIFVVWPNFDTITSKNSELSKAKKDLEVLLGSSQGLERIKTELSEPNQKRILVAMPTQYSPETAIFLLRKISADTGVSIVSYSLPAGVLLNSAPTLGSVASSQMVEFVAYPVRITVAAPVEALLAFISKVESSLPFGVISDLNLQEVTKLSRSSTNKAVQMAIEIRYFQSILKSVNLNKIQTLTPENLKLAKELVDYNLLTVPEESVPEMSGLPASGSGSVFGF